MDRRIDDFMREWLTENVSAEGYPAEAGADPGIEELVERCVINAEAAGISEDELVAAYGDLAVFMREALERAGDDQTT